MVKKGFIQLTTYWRVIFMHKIQGVHTALVTPFDQNGNINEEALCEQVKYQLDNHVDGLVVLGTTGEVPTLTLNEKMRVIQVVGKANKDKSLLTVGTGCYSTLGTIENTQIAKDLGADIALIVTPYYNKPSQEGLHYHFKKIAESVDIPILVYNIAGRTGQNLQTETLKRLSDIPNIVGVKEASGNILQMMDVYLEIKQSRPDFSILSGDDSLTLPAMAIGAQGVVSVVSNLVPGSIKALTDFLLSGDFQAAKRLHYELYPLFKAAFIETNPVPIKASMNYFGMNAGPCRLPLCHLSKENENHLYKILKKYETNLIHQG